MKQPTGDVNKKSALLFKLFLSHLPENLSLSGL